MSADESTFYCFDFKIDVSIFSTRFFTSHRVKKSAYFRREGADVHTDVKLSVSQAAKGGTIRFKGVYRDQEMQVCTIAHCTSAN